VGVKAKILKTIKSGFLSMNKKGFEWTQLAIIILTVLLIIIGLIILGKLPIFEQLKKIFGG
jgi:hypothetical protein